MEIKILIGCSSYYNHKWKGIFYPEDLPAKQWFEYYCNHFKTFEINSSFYRIPTLKSLQTWFEKTPADFTFSVKGPKAITHEKRFVDCKAELDRFYDACRNGLKEKCGPILFQLPPSYQFEPENLQQILDSMNPDFVNVIEFRNESWWNDETFEALRSANVIFCNVSYPKLPETTIETSFTGYFRLHGNRRLFYSTYEREELNRILTDIKNSQFETAYVYFNNTASAAGIENALLLQNLISGI
ncbi:MAG: DUF72 domain-containing protein [Flavobacterium sp.]|nr:MAG: DUF72 domain-containing protein [Flavobacterium sp.]